MAETLSVTDMLPTKFEPLQKRRFIFAIEGIDSFLIKTGKLPTVDTKEIAIPWINSTRYVAGKTIFSTIDVKLHSPIAPSAAQQTMEWVRSCFESVSGRGGYADFYKRDIQVKMLDPVGTVVQLWDIKGAFVMKADYGDLDYGSEADTMEVSLTLRFDNCVLQF